MSLSVAVNYLSLSALYLKSLLSSAISYRASFLIQVLGMFFNNVAWLVMWYIFFQRFPSVNGWGFDQMIFIYAFGALAYAISSLAYGISNLSRYIVSGELDIYLLMPKSVLWSVAMSKADISSYGDGLFGLVFMIIFCAGSATSILWFMFMALISAILFVDFILIIQSLAFWVGDVDDVSQKLNHLLMGFTLYPQSIYKGFLKIITMTIVPAFFVFTIPVQLVMTFSWSFFFILCMAVIIGTSFAVWLFNKGLARYESGNLMVMRQ